ncbi:MAG: hypothetical protein WCO85_07205 [Actinomycetes bacterium]
MSDLINAIDLLVQSTDCVVEYGSGESTVLLAEKGCTVISVETSWNYFLKITERLEGPIVQGRVHCIYADVGTVDQWGSPVDTSPRAAFLRYPLQPWVQIERRELTPQLVVLDGRFRLACFVTSFMKAPLGALILINNFYSRTDYHLINHFAQESERVGDLAVFEVTEKGRNMLDTDLMLSFSSSFLNPL